MKKYIPIIVIVAVLAVTLATCLIANREEGLEDTPAVGFPSEAPAASIAAPPSSAIPTPPPTESPSEEPEPVYDGPVNPLTGLPCTEETTRRRPLAIMINNSSAAQPQLGISKADIIYEAPVEGGITRMMAVYQDPAGAGVIGSIRSARPYYVDLAQGLDAVYIHAGGSPQAYELIKSRGITNLDGVNGGKTDIFYRDSARRKKLGYEHSLCTDSELIAQFLPTYNFRLEHKDGYEQGLLFTKDAAPGGGSADSLTVHFSAAKTTYFEYGQETGLYRVSQFKKPYTDGGNGERVEVSNVIILYAGVKTLDSEGRLSVALTGQGSGYFVCGGSFTEIVWSKKDASSPFVYTLGDGAPLVFRRGRTYCCIIPLKEKVEFN